MNKKVLMLETQYYTSFFQLGGHHYARAFEKLGYEVLYISFPISIFHKIFSNNDEFKERERIYKKGGEKIDNITYYVPYSLITPRNNFILSSKFVIKNWYKFTIPNLFQFISEKGFGEVDILWFGVSTFSYLLSKIKHKKSIFRIADYSKGYKHISQNQFDEDIRLASKVDIVVYTAKNLLEKYTNISNKSKMIYIPNGIDLDFFNNADKSFPDEYKNIPEPRVIYVGAINYWFDVNLVYYCARNLPNHSFVIIGPIQRDLTKIKTLSNVYILGPKPYIRVPQFLFNSNIGIIPFDISNYPELINSINPIKLYEYLVAGLKVVSVKWEEISDLKDYISLCENEDEFIKAILEKNTKEKKLDLSELTWEAKLKKILSTIKV